MFVLQSVVSVRKFFCSYILLTNPYTDQIINFYQDQQQAIIDTLKEEIEARSDALKAKKEYYDYDKTIRSKTKDIQSLETQIAATKAMEDSLEKRKKLLELEEQLANAKDDLESTQQDHEINLVINGLDDFTTQIQDNFDDSVKELKTNLDKKAEIISDANDMYVESFTAIQNKFAEVLKFYGASDTGINASSADYIKIQAEKAEKSQAAKEDYDSQTSKINSEYDTKNKEVLDDYNRSLANVKSESAGESANAKRTYDDRILPSLTQRLLHILRMQPIK